MRASRFGFCVALLCAALSAGATDRGSGHFRKGEVRLEAKHVIAVTVDEEGDAASAQTYVYLSSVPMDAGKVASAFQPSSAAEEQLRDASAGYVRICINAEGGECGLYFSHNNPNASFNSSGYGVFKLDAAPAGRIAGRWVLAEPDDFFGETYDFDLNFDVAITPPPGNPLPADGGEPGKAYRTWTTAIAKGDLPALRALVGDQVSLLDTATPVARRTYSLLHATGMLRKTALDGAQCQLVTTGELAALQHAAAQWLGVPAQCCKPATLG